MSENGPRVGDPAPEFVLENQEGRTVSLEDLAGQWVVLYFYPKDDTPGCTTEACEFSTHLEEFDKLQARVIGVSPDPVERHRKFIAKYDLTIDLLSDPDHQVLKKYGAWGEKTMYGKKRQGVIRSTVVIDPQGKIAHRWRRVRAKGHAEAVRDKLASLRGGA